MDNKEVLSNIHIEERMVAEFNKLFVPEGNTFSLSYPQKLNYAPRSEYRFKNVATEAILRSMDIVNFIKHKIWESETFRNDFSWSSHLSQSSIDLEAILSGRNINDGSLASFSSRSEDRIKIWADPNLSILDCNLLTEKMNIPFEKIWHRDPKIREQRIYAYEAELLVNNKRAERKQSLSPNIDFDIDDSVYNSYRGGTEKDKPNIRELDLTIHSLLLSKSFVVDKRYPNLLIPAEDLDKGQTNLLKRVFEILDGWRGDAPSGEFEFVAINSSVERIFQQYDFLGVTWPFFKDYQSFLDNPGFLLELGVILTEKTREYLFETGKIKAKYLANLKEVHPDVNKQKYNTDASQITIACYKILSDKDNFEKWFKGANMYSI